MAWQEKHWIHKPWWPELEPVAHIKEKERCNYTKCPSDRHKSSATHTTPFPVLTQTHMHTHEQIHEYHTCTYIHTIAQNSIEHSQNSYIFRNINSSTFPRKTWHCWTWGKFTAQYSVPSMTTGNILALILDLRKEKAVLKPLKFPCGSFTGFAATWQSLWQNYWDSQEEAGFKAVTLWIQSVVMLEITVCWPTKKFNLGWIAFFCMKHFFLCS